MGRPLSGSLTPLLSKARTDETLLVEIGSLPEAPVLAPSPVNSGAGSIAAGTYNWLQTFVDVADFEGPASPASVDIVAGGSFQATVGINTGPTSVAKRRLYRSSDGGIAPYKLVATIADNTTTSYVDNVASGSLGATQADPKLRFTNYGKDITQTIDGVLRTFVTASIEAQGIGQSLQSGLEDAAVAIWNVDLAWSSYLLNQGSRGRRVRVWQGWFNETTGAWVEEEELFDGRANEFNVDEGVAVLTLLPHNAPWSLKMPGTRYTGSCSSLFRGVKCRYGIPYGASVFVGPTLAQSGAAGLANGTYWYCITGLDGSGESLPSFSSSITVTGGPKQVDLSWTAFPGAGMQKFRVYRGTAQFLEQYIGETTGTTLSDTGLSTTAARPPMKNMAGGGTSCGRTYEKDCSALFGNTIHFRGHRTLLSTVAKVTWNFGTSQLPTREEG